MYAVFACAGLSPGCARVAHMRDPLGSACLVKVGLADMLVIFFC